MCILYEKQKRCETSYQSLFKLPNMFTSFLSLVIQHETNFDALILRGFWVIQKIEIDLRKPFHDLILVSFSTSSKSLKILDKKQKNCIV